MLLLLEPTFTYLQAVCTPTTHIPLYTHYAIVTLSHIFYRNEVMECLLARSNELPTACRVIIKNEQHEQVV